MFTPFETLAAWSSTETNARIVNDIRAHLAFENEEKGDTEISRETWEVLFAALDAHYSDLASMIPRGVESFIAQHNKY